MWHTPWICENHCKVAPQEHCQLHPSYPCRRSDCFTFHLAYIPWKPTMFKHIDPTYISCHPLNLGLRLDIHSEDYKRLAGMWCEVLFKKEPQIWIEFQPDLHCLYDMTRTGWEHQIGLELRWEQKWLDIKLGLVEKNSEMRKSHKRRRTDTHTHRAGRGEKLVYQDVEENENKKSSRSSCCWSAFQNLWSVIGDHNSIIGKSDNGYN